MNKERTSGQKKKASFPATLCKIIRILTIPALLACLLALVLFFEKREIAWYHFFLLALFDGIIPALSYPVCFLVPKLREKGRDAERKAAFVFSIAGYTGGVIWALLSRAPRVLMTAYLSYFCSVLLLTFVNKVVKLKASGHACGIAGPLVLLAALCGPWYIPLCVCIAAAVVFSSLYLKRHAPKELLFGALCSIVPTVLLWLLYFVILT